MYIIGLVLDVESLQETTFVHSEQISSMQNTDAELDIRVTALENSANGSIPSNTTGTKYIF